MRLALELGLRLRREGPDDDVEQVRDAAAVQRADGMRLCPAENVELGRLQLALLVVGFVGGNDHRRVRGAQDLRRFLVRWCEASLRVDDEDDDVSFLDRQPRLLLDTLLDRVWSESDGADPSYVWVTVRRLRRKLELDPDRPRYLLTDRGVGYRLTTSPARAPAANA